MRTKALTALTTALVLLMTFPAYASAQSLPPEPPPSDNGRWTGVIAFFALVGVAAVLIFIARAYSKNGDNQK